MALSKSETDLPQRITVESGNWTKEYWRRGIIIYKKILAPLDGSDQAITMGCMDEAKACPAAFITTEDWALTDPEGKTLEGVRQIRDEVKRRVALLVRRLT